MPARLKIKQKAVNRLDWGHLWVYQDEIENHKPELAGAIVRIESSSGEFLGQGFYNPKSKISFRLLTRSSQAIGREFFEKKIQEAVKRRGKNFSPESAVRLIYAEADGLPGLIADWYAGSLVLQCLILGTEQLKEVLADICWEMLKPHALWFRNDASGRELEGLGEDKFLWRGKEEPEVEIVEGGLKFLVNLLEGHKTGAYLDQAENRLRARELAKGRCLDAFSYQGGFALQMAQRAEEVLAVDGSESALKMLEKNLELNNLKKVKPLKKNIFSLLSELEANQERFSVIVLDPPPFAKSKKDLSNARRGYYELNRRALGLLEPGGLLLTYSCSYHFPLLELLETVRSALAETNRRGNLLEIHRQSLDHPILLTVPETWYLKGLVLEVE